MIRKLQHWWKELRFRKRTRERGLENADSAVVDDHPIKNRIEGDKRRTDDVLRTTIDELDSALESYDDGDKAQSVHDLRMARWNLLYHAAMIEARQRELERDLSLRELNDWNIRNQVNTGGGESDR